MPNNLEMFKAYLPLVDEVFRTGSTTADIDTLNGGLIQYVEATHEFKIPVYSTNGLGNYERNGKGYPEGSVTLTFENKKPNYDRGVKFGVEDQDNTETVGIAFGNLADSFMRNHVIPETDAFRFSKYFDANGYALVYCFAMLLDGDGQKLSLFDTTRKAMKGRHDVVRMIDFDDKTTGMKDVYFGGKA